jgi:endonuclease YncB( thermonuclease family)
VPCLEVAAVSGIRPKSFAMVQAASLLFVALATFTSARAEEEAKEGEGTSATKNLLEELTINMASEAIDAQTFMVRDTGSKGEKKHIRLGNVGLPEKGEMSDAEYQEKLDEAKAALAAFVDKQMVFWKEAPAELQPEVEEGATPVVIADAWTIDGRHITSMLTKAGHLKSEEKYKSEIARDILSAEADEKKKDSYKKLEEALAQSNKEQEAKEEEEEEDPVEPLGISGWIGIAVLVVTVGGALTNFGRPTSKRTNPNKKRSFFQSILSKLKLQ